MLGHTLNIFYDVFTNLHELQKARHGRGTNLEENYVLLSLFTTLIFPLFTVNMTEQKKLIEVLHDTYASCCTVSLSSLLIS